MIRDPTARPPMALHRKSHRLLLAVLGLSLLAGCRVLRGPEPFGPTYVSPPGPVVSGPVTAVPQRPQRLQPETFLQPNTVNLRVSGPSTAAVGETVTYRIEVRNCRQSVARDVAVACPLPQGLSYVSGTPNGIASPEQVRWQLGDLAGCGRSTIEARFRAETAGNFNVCADVSTAGGTLLRECAITSVTGQASTSPLQVDMTAPQQVRVGETVSFRIVITNRASTKATAITLTSDFDDGLIHEGGPSPIQRKLDRDLEPGESRTVGATFKVNRAGRLCNRVTISAEGGLEGKAETCVTAIGNASLSVRQTAPMTLTVGGKGVFRIEVKNNGDEELTDVVVRGNFDAPLKPIQATQFDRPVGVNKVGDRYELTPWRFDKLEPGKTLEFEVECEGVAASTRACGRVTVTSAQGVREQAETCLSVTNP